MSDRIYITRLEVENVKRVKAVQMEVAEPGLTTIGGRNAQGKTSILDAIMWSLGGDRYKPSSYKRDGAAKVATKIELSNGLIVERTGTSGNLKVSDPSGRKAGQSLINEFVSQFALDLPQFMAASCLDKTKILLEGFPDLQGELTRLDEQYKEIYTARHSMGQEMTRRQKHAEDLPYHDDVPDEPLSGAEMAKRMQEALAHNARNAEVRKARSEVERDLAHTRADLTSAEEQVSALKRQLAQTEERVEQYRAKASRLATNLHDADKDVANLKDRDTSMLQHSLEEIDTINAKVRTNLTKVHAQDQAEQIRSEYNLLSGRLDVIKASKVRLLQEAKLPLPDLTIDMDGQLVFNNRQWDSMSGMEQIRVAVAVAAAAAPHCGFVLMDKLEQFDTDQLSDFAFWLEGQGLQCIGTRVSTGSECSIIIEDGAVQDELEF